MLLEFINFITRERQIYTETLLQEPRHTHKGLVRRGFLPHCYILYTIEIMKGVKKGIYLSQFADDIGVYVKCKSDKRGKKMLTKAVSQIKKT